VFERPFDLRRESQVQPGDTLNLRTANTEQHRAAVDVDSFDRPAEVGNGTTDLVGNYLQVPRRGFDVAQELAFVSAPMRYVSQSGGDVRAEEGHRLVARTDAATALCGRQGEAGDIRPQAQPGDELRLPSAESHEYGMDQALRSFRLLAQEFPGAAHERASAVHLDVGAAVRGRPLQGRQPIAQFRSSWRAQTLQQGEHGGIDSFRGRPGLEAGFRRNVVNDLGISHGPSCG